MSEAQDDRLTGQRAGPAQGLLVSLALAGAVTVLGDLLFQAGNIANTGLLYLVPVMVAATRYGLRIGLVTGLVCALLYNFFFIPPTHTLTIEDPQNIVTVLVLLGVAVVASQLAGQVRASALSAQRSADFNSALARFAEKLVGISDRDSLAHALCEEVAALMDGRTIFLVPENGELVPIAASTGAAADPLEMLDRAAAQWCLGHARPAGRGTDTLSAAEWRFAPLVGADRVLGVVGLARPDSRDAVPGGQGPLFAGLLDQARLGLERIAFESERTAVGQLRERDRLRAALLSSVSHDLRTPLTTILGTLAAIEPADDVQREQVAAARGEADRLARFVANLLDMVRIETGALHRTTEPVDLSEAVASAVHDLRRALAGHELLTDLSPDLPLVMVNPQLFHHCLINLIENAAKYSEPGTAIAVSGEAGPDGLTLSVADRGPGIPAGEEERIFGTFTRMEGSDRKGGSGLGLAIVRGFAEAMALEVSARNRADGHGAVFTIGFPAAILRPIGELQ